MLADLTRAVATYLHDVFVIQLSWWVALGFVAQAMFFMRFAVQWIASERAGRSVVPTAFWIFFARAAEDFSLVRKMTLPLCT